MEITRESFRTILQEELRLFAKDVMGSALSEGLRQIEESVRRHPQASSPNTTAPEPQKPARSISPIWEAKTGLTEPRVGFRRASTVSSIGEIEVADDHELKGWRRRPSKVTDDDGKIPLKRRGSASIKPLNRRPSIRMPLLDNIHLGSDRQKRLSETKVSSSSQDQLTPRKSWGAKRVNTSQFVRSLEFDYIVAVTIILNAAVIASQTNYMATNWTSAAPQYYTTLEVLFCLIFSTEMAARIFVERRNFFCNSTEWGWNLFDLFVTSLQFIETVLVVSITPNGKPNFELNEFTADTNILQVLRVFRITRILRVLRVLHLVGELRAIITAIGASMRPLCWTAVLLLLLTFVFGVFLTQVVTDHKVVHPKLASASLEEWYGSLFTSMLTLFEAISDGKEWCDMMNPLVNQISPWMVYPFIAYIAFVIFALINILTGIFVDRTIRAGKADHRQFLLEHVQSAITHSSADGKVSWEDFQAHLQDPDVKLLFEEIDVDQSDAHELFHLLDTNQTGSVDVEQFISGCMRLDGPAKAVDLAVLAEMHRRQGSKWVEQMKFVNSSLTAIRGAVGKTSAESDMRS